MEKSRIIDKIYTFIERNMERDFVIFGTSNGAHRTVSNMGYFFKKVIYFVDNYPKKNTFYNLPIYKPSYLKELNNKPFIFIASEYYDEISLQLQEMGYEPEKDFIYSLKFIDPHRDYTKSNIVNGKVIGKFTYGYEPHCYRSNVLKSIGAFCSINRNARIGDINHPLTAISTHPILYLSTKEKTGIENISGISDELRVDISNENDGTVVIGNDVWIGANAVILPNVKIGDGAIIGAGAIVTKDVEPYTIVVGVPAKPIRKRYTDEEIEILLKVKWWDWDNVLIRERLHLLENPKLFFNSYRIGEFD